MEFAVEFRRIALYWLTKLMIYKFLIVWIENYKHFWNNSLVTTLDELPVKSEGGKASGF